MKIIFVSLAICLFLRTSSSSWVTGLEVLPEDWDDEVDWDDEKTVAKIHQGQKEESERFKKLVSISNEFNPLIFEGELIDGIGDAHDEDDKTRRGRKLLQASSASNEQAALLVFKQGITMDPNGTLNN